MTARRGMLSGGARPADVAALGLSFAMLAGETMAKTFDLAIGGEGGARFSGACTVLTPSGDETVELRGTVPLRRAFDGDGLTCRFQVEGQVVVEIVHHGGRSRSATNGGTILVSAR